MFPPKSWRAFLNFSALEPKVPIFKLKTRTNVAHLHKYVFSQQYLSTRQYCICFMILKKKMEVWQQLHESTEKTFKAVFLYTIQEARKINLIRNLAPWWNILKDEGEWASGCNKAKLNTQSYHNLKLDIIILNKTRHCGKGLWNSCSSSI